MQPLRSMKPSPDRPPVPLRLPFDGPWLARNSPARRVPSHGTDLMGSRYAIDFIGVDARRRTADRRDWRTLLASEPPERYVAYGRPVLAPADGVVVAAHDGVDGPDPAVARGLPMVFRRFRESPRRGPPFAHRESGLPAESAVVVPC